jgi:hypothetical protein
MTDRIYVTMVVLLVALIVSASTVSSQQAQQFAQGPSERSIAARKRVEVAEITGKSAAECSVRLRGFIEELDGMLSWVHSVYPIQSLFEKYFPVTGCDPGAVLELCLKSKYCRDASAEPSILVIAFDSQRNKPHWGLYAQFGLDRRSGDSLNTFVKVKI